MSFIDKSYTNYHKNITCLQNNNKKQNILILDMFNTNLLLNIQCATFESKLVCAQALIVKGFLLNRQLTLSNCIISCRRERFANITISQFCIMLRNVHHIRLFHLKLQCFRQM